MSTIFKFVNFKFLVDFLFSHSYEIKIYKNLIDKLLKNYNKWSIYKEGHEYNK